MRTLAARRRDRRLRPRALAGSARSLSPLASRPAASSPRGRGAAGSWRGPSSRRALFASGESQLVRRWAIFAARRGRRPRAVRLVSSWSRHLPPLAKAPWADDGLWRRPRPSRPPVRERDRATPTSNPSVAGGPGAAGLLLARRGCLVRAPHELRERLAALASSAGASSSRSRSPSSARASRPGTRRR